MGPISLLYHDVISRREFDASGFPGLTAAGYKLDVNEFARHLKAIAETVKEKPVGVADLLEGKRTISPLLLTFDDGGASAYTHVASMLEGFGWRGHFLIAANYIGTASFVSRDQIRDLKRRGHVIGSHSCSHPERMSNLSWEELVEEWSKSLAVLSEILGEQVCVASVPNGYFSRKVAKAASFTGIKALFTSEPTTRSNYVDGCLVLGRYSLKRETPPEIAAGLASGQLSPRLSQFLFWNSKKVAKSLGGELYLKIRKSYLRRVAG